MAAALRKLPVTLAQDVASKAAPDLTARARASFEAGETVYGTARQPGKDGHAVTLHKTGKLLATILFKAIGKRVRAVLGVPYARYNVRFGILPRGGSAMPTDWAEGIAKLTKEAIERTLP